MKACTSLLSLALGLASLSACSGGDTTATTSTSSSGATSTSASASSTTGGGGAGGSSTTTGGGGAASSTGASSSGAGGMAAFALTSTGFTEGSAIPVKYANAGLNVSPDLSWVSGPPSTLSYAVVMTDKSNNNLLHWVIWDIPVASTTLPEGVKKVANPAVPPGSKQAKSYDNQTFGYLGPNPPSIHTYEFAVFALDIATLPGVTTASTRAQVDTAILMHDLGSATLTGTYTP